MVFHSLAMKQHLLMRGGKISTRPLDSLIRCVPELHVYHFELGQPVGSRAARC